MNFDVVIIGGGLAGLTCGIALQSQGKRCAIVNNGQAAIDFASGSMDLLARDPASGQVLSDIRQGLPNLAPTHPYHLFGAENVLAKSAQFEELARSLNLNMLGSNVQNHLRITPLGGLRPTWLSPDSVPTVAIGEPFAYQKIAILGIEGYHDFQPQLLAENLKQNAQFAHCECSVGFLHIPELDYLRQNSREFRSVNIAQLLAHKLAFADLVEEIKQAAGSAQAVFLPACFGLDDQSFFNSLKQATGLALFELPTLPPSLLGIRQHRQLRLQFEKLGGLMMNGDKALRAEFNGNRVSRIFTTAHEDEPIEASHFVLATGSFFSNGLIAEFEEIREPLFGLDIHGSKSFEKNDRLSWTNNRFSQPQPYHTAGVVITAQGKAVKNGEPLANLYAIGNVLGGYDGINEGCGSGVAIVSALTVADEILK